MAHGAAEVQQYVRTCMVVFASLAGLTVVTVAISYVHLPIAQAVALALVVASVKASLVALYFMHLISEQKTIYWVLALTALFFVALMYLPITWDSTLVETDRLWDSVPVEGSAKPHGEAHGDEGHGGGEAHH
jgi:cytochrome c oxidase subunit 4